MIGFIIGFILGVAVTVACLAYVTHRIMKAAVS